MNLYDAMFRRKSCRRYAMEPLPEAFLREMEEAIRGFDALYPDVPLAHRLVGEAKGRFSVQAPHYLVISGQGKAGELENAGFIFQQLVLWLDAREVGSVWLGASKALEANPGGQDIIMLALGKGEETIHRGADGFKRKAIGEITNAPEDPCIQAVHLAPSGMNLQPWYLERGPEGTMLYRQDLGLPYALLYKLTDVDMGIALCHYAVAAKHQGLPFAFARRSAAPPRKGYKPFGII